MAAGRVGCRDGGGGGGRSRCGLRWLYLHMFHLLPNVFDFWGFLHVDKLVLCGWGMLGRTVTRTREAKSSQNDNRRISDAGNSAYTHLGVVGTSGV